ncbi:MAG: glycosyltransferase family 2 protein [Solirubrobacterales bacterium]|nr:glycosyltransferase family 2 protein [Solirubrobacterales bacterium]
MGTPVRHTISACLIVLNEERDLPHALASVAFCDEVVVVDSGSTDRTREVARAAGATVVENPWPGFGAQRNVAADHATGDWVLEVDADETITPELAEEILDFLATPGPRDRIDLLALPMRHRFLGGDLGPSVQYPNYRTRMFRRGTYRHDEGRTVHEGLKPRDATLALRGDMVHVLAASWGEALGDVWRYTKLEAGQFHPRVTPRGAAVGILARPTAKAGYRLVVDGAWRDGWRGLVKVALDAGSDAVVWLRVLARRETPEGPGDTHFGEVMPAAGPIRVVALATTEEGARRAAEWLDGAISAGAGTDSELVTPVPTPPAGAGFFVRPTPTGGPLSFARALLGAGQVRGIDAILLADAGARRAHRALAPRVRGAAGPLSPETPPADAVRELTRARR